MKNTDKLKFFNKRPFLIILICLITGILLLNYYLYKTTIFFVLLSVFLLVLTVYSIRYRSLTIFAVCFLICIAGVFLLAVEIRSFNQKPDIAVGSQVVGVIKERREKYSNRYYVSIKTINGIECDGVLDVICQDTSVDYNFADGSEVYFSVTDFSESSLFYRDIINERSVGNDIKYRVITNEMSLIKVNKTLRYRVRERIRKSLYKCLSNENAELIYSTFFGNKTDLNTELYESYQITGVAHILAVSGLHVGIVVLVLKKILQKLKVNKYAILAIILAFLIFYAYLCNWSVSVLRAGTMAVIGILAPLFFKRYDFLTSISFAGVLLLVIRPSSLFSISFVLSFMAVLGICLIFPIFEKWLKKKNITNSTITSLALSIATNFALIGPSVYYFTTVNPMGIISNIIVLPLFSVIFIGSFILVMMSLVLPFLSYLFYLINPLIDVLNLLVTMLSRFSFSFEANEIGFIVIINWAIFLLFLSKFNLKKGWIKAVSVLIIFSIFALQLGLKIY